MEQLVDHILASRKSPPIVCIGPVVRKSDVDLNPNLPPWYFVVASGEIDPGDPGDSDLSGTFEVDLFGCPDESSADGLRRTFFAALAKHSLLIHDFDDELELAMLCMALWPCAKTRQICATIEAERVLSAAD
jgi:hypothetical protein